MKISNAKQKRHLNLSQSSVETSQQANESKNPDKINPSRNRITENIVQYNNRIDAIVSKPENKVDKREIDIKAERVHEEIHKLDVTLNEVKTILQRLIPAQGKS